MFINVFLSTYLIIIWLYNSARSAWYMKRMIAKSSCCLYRNEKGLAELAEMNDDFFKKIEFKVCKFDYPG